MAATTLTRVETRSKLLHPGRIILYVVTIALTLMFIFPFAWTISSSLKTSSEVVGYPPSLIPGVVQWGNYYQAWTSIQFGTFFKNSLIVVVLTVAGGTSSAFVVTYGFARFRFPGRDAVFGLCLATMILPPEVTIIPLFLTFK